jgi:hypothetical protein
MTVYVAAFICGGPWLGSDPARRNVPQIAIAVMLAVLAARGRRSARILMTSYSVLGAFAVLYSSTHWGPSEPVADSFLALACALVQIGLLVSTPMYERTRPGWSPRQLQPGSWLPWPNLPVVLVGAAGGLVMALLPFSDGIRETVCREGGLRSAQACGAAGYGYPIAYRFAYNNLAPRGIDLASLATDWALWTVSILLVLYLVQVSKSRENTDAAQRPTVHPVPARP